MSTESPLSTEPEPNTAPLPTLHEAWLTRAEVEQLAKDVENAAELLDITLKSGGTRRAELAAGETCSLRQAVARLLRREVVGVQIRYRHAGEEWWDTLLSGESGIRLVRVNHSRAVTPPGRG
ncbi:MAG TPA: hypothetical protein VFQ61_12570 [Polyangiaceae bacterium]|nr:hypothetical protein [Polyangiaceae bacterium]